MLGEDRRPEPVDNLRGKEPIDPITRNPAGVPAPRNVQAPGVDSFTAAMAQSVSQFASGRLLQLQKKKQEAAQLDGQLAAMQGESFENVKMKGDKWALEGWRVVTAASLASSLLRAQEQEIASGAYEADPDSFRATLNGRIEAMTADIPDERTRTMAREQLIQQMPVIVDAHMKQHLGHVEQKNFDALAQSVDTLSRDKGATEALIGFATGSTGVTAGLSDERRKAAVTAGIVNAFTNDNPAAHAHLEAAGFLTTENLTAAQLASIRSAQSSYHARMESEWNGEWKEEITALEDRIQRGQVNPLDAAQEFAAINSKHNRRTSSSAAGGVYDAARAGVEFDQGTRGMNIRTAGMQGNYSLQADLVMDALIQQESGGRQSAVSPKGARGITQVMPATAHDPGLRGVRNVYQIADSLGVSYSGKSVAEADRLLQNEAVNRVMGKEYLVGVLARYNGNIELALAAYNAGPGAVDQYGGIPPFKETQGYVRNIMSMISDDRPDPEGARRSAEAAYEQARQEAQLHVLEAAGPRMAMNDELYIRGQIGLQEWRAEHRAVAEEWGIAVDSQRLNQEQQMMRSVMGNQVQARIDELAEIEQIEIDRVENTQKTSQAIQLRSAQAVAEQNLEDNTAAFVAGTSTLTLDEINQQYASEMIAAYESSGVPYNAEELSKAIAGLVPKSAKVVAAALKSQEDSAIIYDANRAGTVGTLPKNLQDRALKEFRTSLDRQVANYQAENPDASPAQIGAMARQKEVEYIARNGIYDEALQQQINLAGSGNWLDSSGKPRPDVAVGLHSYMSLAAENPELATQYVEDPVVRGRILAATHMVQTMFPDVEAFTQVDLNDPNDPIANAMYRAVEQVGIGMAAPISPEKTQERLDRALGMLDKGNITGGFFGEQAGWTTSDIATSLIPSSLLVAAASSTFTAADVDAARGISSQAINNTYRQEVQRFIEDVVPHMPGVSDKSAVQMAMDHVRERGAVMGSSYVMPKDGQPSIRAQMFPGQQVNSTAAVNTAIVQWMADPEVQKNEPRLRGYRESGIFQSPSEFSVKYVNGNYIAFIAGVGGVVLPLREIGDRYVNTR